MSADDGISIPIEPIGSIPRPFALIEAVLAHGAGTMPESVLDELHRDAITDTIRRFEATGSPVITGGEQCKYHDFDTCAMDGLAMMAQDGFRLQFTGHDREWPRLTSGQFRYPRYADSFLAEAMQQTTRPMKQAVIAPAAPSLIYADRDLIGVIDVLHARLETAEEVRDAVLDAARYIPLAQLGTTDDCGDSPFSDGVSTSRDLAFAKITARVRGTAMASEILSASRVR
jgi:methionine synthase II (cobalamin-independent)